MDDDFELDMDFDDITLYEDKRSKYLKIAGAVGAVVGVLVMLALFTGAGVVIGLTACSPDDSNNNNSTLSSPSISETQVPSPSISPQEFWEKISLPDIVTHLEALQGIADANEGTRSINSPGFNASINYIASQLHDKTNFIVSIQPFAVNVTVQLEDPLFESITPNEQVYTTPDDYAPLQYSGSGDALEHPQLIAGLGCSPEDFSSFISGRIALIPRGDCSFLIKATNAKFAGATGTLVYNYEDQTAATQGTLTTFVDMPVFGITYSLGQSFIADPTILLHMNNSVSLQTTYTSNLIAETTTGDENAIVTIGSHLDSVDAGPGINDNGSGSSANLQIALQFESEVNYVNKVRFLWYGAEEEGLLGSTYYVNSLSDSERDAIALNLNFDMLGSPNYIRGILNGTDSTMNGSKVIMETFEDFFNMNDLNYDIIPFTGRSDYGPYLEANIPAGGVETGAELIKDEEGRRKFGGLANAPFDPCYHQACDTIENVNTEVLLQTSQAAAYALSKFATDSDLRNSLER